MFEDELADLRAELNPEGIWKPLHIQIAKFEVENQKLKHQILKRKKKHRETLPSILFDDDSI
jgi:hypothetical protein